MKVRTKRDSSISTFKGTSLRAGGQTVRNMEYRFRKGLTSSIDGEEDTDGTNELQSQMTIVEWKEFLKLPSWQKRKYERKLDKRMEKVSANLEAEKERMEELAYVSSDSAPAGNPSIRNQGEAFAYGTDTAGYASDRGMPYAGGTAYAKETAYVANGAYARGQAASHTGAAAAQNISPAQNASGMQTTQMLSQSRNVTSTRTASNIKAARSASDAGKNTFSVVAAKGTSAMVQTAAAAKSTAGAAASSNPYSAAAVAAASAVKKTAEEIKTALAGSMASKSEMAKQELAAAAKEETVSASAHSMQSAEGESSGIMLLLSAVMVPVLLAMAPILIVMMFIGSFATLFQQPEPETPVIPDIVAVACQELEEQEGITGGQKYKQWYGFSGDWCAMFVSYCANECGYIESGIMPRSASVAYCIQWYGQHARYHSAAGYTPEPGDIIFFGNGMSHTGIVTDYDPQTQIVTTIEGNTGVSLTTPYHNGSRVMEKTYAADYVHIIGYASPDYPVEETEEEAMEGD